ncbi:(R)-mandelonitrile lyase [Peredibacter starrii]|uniref:Cupin domain-containing protein n=1 Tax=Peredibacter starrii TaxID=28202 RepID=A0AAX4HTR8_9BACT|nr:cupin domain-containing protein [Peredibacter starrii]WPU66563.1 cupin domain-containing protein [Peredibacter starrii]
MKAYQILAVAVCLTLNLSYAEDISITKEKSREEQKGPEAYFTGKATIKPLFTSPVPARTQGASVKFEAGARTAWHSHPLGQTLIVTDGEGYVQEKDGKVHRIKKGDVVWTPPGVKHWHGAGQRSSMTHLAIQESLDGKVVEWMEKVTDAEYKEVKNK